MKLCKLTTILFLIIFGLKVDAQVSFGIKAGIGSIITSSEETYAVTSDNIITYKLAYNETSSIKSIGLYSQLESGYLYFRPEVLYSTAKHYYSIMNFLTDDPIDVEMIEKNETIDLNMIGGLIINNLRLGVGPSFHILAKKSNPLEDMEKIQFNSRKLTTGFNFVIGFDLGRLSFDVKYENVFSRVGDHIIIENQKSGLKASPDCFNFAVGLKF